jgi:uncharacterized protein (UPF0333 family)
MKTVAIGISAVLFGIIAIVIMSYISAFNYGNQMERQLDAKYSDMEVTLANASNKVADLAKVPAMYKNDAVELIKAEMQGRYGQEGSKATFQFFQEKGIQLDPSLYRRIQQEIVTGRNEFTATQKQLITIKQQYETQLGSFWKGMWLGIAGYPKVDLSKYKIISSGHAQDAFKTGVDNGFKF